MITSRRTARNMRTIWAVMSTSVLSGSAFADNRVWINGGGGFFSDSGNWQNGTLPGGSDTAQFFLGGAYTVRTPSNPATISMEVRTGTVTFRDGGYSILSVAIANQFAAGVSRGGTMNLFNTVFRANTFHVGTENGGSGTLRVVGANTSFISPFWVGYVPGSSGTMIVSDGAYVEAHGIHFPAQATSDGAVGGYPGTRGTLTIEDKGTTVLVPGGLNIGGLYFPVASKQGSQGTITVRTGASLSVNHLSLVPAPSSLGTASLLVQDAGTRLDVPDVFEMGGGGTSQFTIESGAWAIAGRLIASVRPTVQSCDLSVMGKGTKFTIEHEAAIGVEGPATFVVGDQARFDAESLKLGIVAGASASMTIALDASAFVSGPASVGLSGNAEVTISGESQLQIGDSLALGVGGYAFIRAQQESSLSAKRIDLAGQPAGDATLRLIEDSRCSTRDISLALPAGNASLESVGGSLVRISRSLQMGEGAYVVCDDLALGGGTVSVGAPLVMDQRGLLTVGDGGELVANGDVVGSVVIRRGRLHIPSTTNVFRISNSLRMSSNGIVWLTGYPGKDYSLWAVDYGGGAQFGTIFASSALLDEVVVDFRLVNGAQVSPGTDLILLDTNGIIYGKRGPFAALLLPSTPNDEQGKATRLWVRVTDDQVVASVRRVGDYNLDGVVDKGDLTTFVTGLNGRDIQTDLNGDGRWNGEDYKLFVTLWQESQ